MILRVVFLMVFFWATSLVFTWQGVTGLDLEEKIANGSIINWTKGSIKAYGQKDIEKTKEGEFLNSEESLRAATAMAHDHLLEAARCVRIGQGSTVGDLADNDEHILEKLKTMVKSTAISHQEYASNGMVFVTMDMSFFGGFSQLVLPKEIEHVEPIRSVQNPPVQSPVGGQSAPEGGKKSEREIFTGLMVDARGLRVLPAMTPEIFDENNQEIYGPAFVSREIAVQQGMCRYEGDVSIAKANDRVGSKPLTVRALRGKSTGSAGLVISKTDALKIKSASEHLTFLKQCRVVVVVDGNI